LVTGAAKVISYWAVPKSRYPNLPSELTVDDVIDPETAGDCPGFDEASEWLIDMAVPRRSGFMEVKFTASMTTKRKQKATTPAAVSVPRVAPPPRPESAPVGGGGAVVTERTLARQTSDLTPEE
jgi:hypothetical protein